MQLFLTIQSTVSQHKKNHKIKHHNVQTTQQPEKHRALKPPPCGETTLG